ncbi:PAS domain S-box protein [Sphingomonas ginsenosidivorax]|uniref:PAS domain S-box protein n=1 Tax=Sphingomonas ginsenosidivorax TaxID=862135 RepID=UPI0013156388|nr:PAS domain S-box protein [Sphingomonas ginsenosidivorax]
MAIGFFVLASAAIMLTRFNGGVALLWVANAPLLAYLCRTRYARWPAALLWTAVASMAASVLFGPVLWASPIFGIASILEAVLAAAVLRYLLPDPDYFASSKSVLIFAAVAGIAAPMASGVIAAATAWLAFGRAWAPIYIDWVVGRGLGMLIAMPIVAMLTERTRRGTRAALGDQLVGEGGILLLAVAVTTAAVFMQESLPLLFLPALPVLLATFKLGRRGAALSIGMVAIIGWAATTSGHGPVMMTSLTKAGRFQFFQLYLAATVLMSLPVAGSLGQTRKLLLALESSEARHRRIVERSQDVVFETDVRGNWTFLSDAWVRLTGREIADSLGQPSNLAVLEADRPKLEAAARDAQTSADAIGHAEVQFANADGVRWAAVNVGILRDGDNRVVGSYGTIRDVTERKRLEARTAAAFLQVREANRLFGMAGAIASIGHWRFEIASGNVIWSDEVFNIHGLPVGTPPPLAAAVDFYHPDDRARIEAELNAAIAEKRGFEWEARLIGADGRTRHVVAQGQVELDDAGEMVAMFGVFQDVTERALSEAARRDSEARFRLITEQASDMIALIDLDGVILFMSPASTAILGTSPEDMVGTRPKERMHPDDKEAIDAYRIKLHASAGRSPTSVRFRLCRADGNYAWIEASSRLTDVDGAPCVITVWRDVSDQVAIEAELTAAKAAAEAASVAKAGFLANMSHEIRTPMNGVIGFAELLLASDLTPGQRRDAGLIADSGKTMMKLLNDILDLSKIEAGQLDVVAEPFDLPHAVRACGKLLAPGAAQKHLAFDVTVADDVPRFVIGDGLRVRQVVLNLVGNAIKFTAQGSVALCVELTEDHGEPWLAITVRDTGIGIAPDRQSAIFEEFVQADHSITRRYGGTGLGLAISNRLATLMGGRILVDSVVGQGTAVTLMLPAAIARTQPTPTPDSSTPPHTSAAPSRVLLAEDHEVNQLLVRAMLAHGGHSVVLVQDGQAAVDAVRESVAAGTPFDLVLMDMQMPVMDGLAATRAIRAAEPAGQRRLPIVALTANAFAADLDSCRAAGMDDHVAKPVSMEALLAAVDRWSRPATTQPTCPPAAKFQPSAAVRDKYAEHRARTLEHIDTLVRRGTFTDAELEDAAGLLHKLAGTAGMFGETALGDRASELEDGMSDWPEDERSARIVAGAALLRNAA